MGDKSQQPPEGDPLPKPAAPIGDPPPKKPAAGDPPPPPPRRDKR